MEEIGALNTMSAAVRRGVNSTNDRLSIGVLLPWCGLRRLAPIHSKKENGALLARGVDPVNRTGGAGLAVAVGLARGAVRRLGGALE